MSEEKLSIFEQALAMKKVPECRNDIVAILPESQPENQIQVVQEARDKEQCQIGIVLNAGPGLYQCGKRPGLDLNCGDRVVFRNRGRTEIEWGGTQVVLITENIVFAVLERGPNKE